MRFVSPRRQTFRHPQPQSCIFLCCVWANKKKTSRILGTIGWRFGWRITSRPAGLWCAICDDVVARRCVIWVCQSPFFCVHHTMRNMRVESISRMLSCACRFARFGFGVRLFVCWFFFDVPPDGLLRIENVSEMCACVLSVKLRKTVWYVSTKLNYRSWLFSSNFVSQRDITAT